MNNKEIGMNIYTKRREKKLTQRALGEIIGKSEATIRKYEKGNIEIPNSVLERLAAALDTHVPSLLFYDVNMSELQVQDLVYGCPKHIFDSIEKKLRYRVVSQMSDNLTFVSSDGVTLQIPESELEHIVEEVESFAAFKFAELLKKYK